MKNTTRRLAGTVGAIALIGVGTAGVLLSVTGTANAGTMPGTGNTIAMTINNDTGQTLQLQGTDNPYGQWIAAPRTTLAPYSSEIVTAANTDSRGLGVDVVYSVPGNGQAVFMANNYPGQSDTSGTRMTGPDGHWYAISSHVDTGNPTMNVGYDIVMN